VRQKLTTTTTTVATKTAMTSLMKNV